MSDPTHDETREDAEPGAALTGSGAPEPDAGAPGAVVEPDDDDAATEEHPEPQTVGGLVHQDNVTEPGMEHTHYADGTTVSHQTVEGDADEGDEPDDD